MNIVAILAGGSGKRVGGDVPKQFMNFNGRMLLEYTIEAFEINPLVDRIMVVVSKNFVDSMCELCGEMNYPKWDMVVEGGPERYLSSYAAICACEEDDANILIHDAARPFVSQKLITQLIEALEDCPAAVPATPLTDTLVEVRDDCIISVPSRQNYRFVQTPQAFHLSLIRTAFDQVINDAKCCFTDDCSVLLSYDKSARVKVVEGDENNQKLTYNTDIEYFARIFEKNIEK